MTVSSSSIVPGKGLRAPSPNQSWASMKRAHFSRHVQDVEPKRPSGCFYDSPRLPDFYGYDVPPRVDCSMRYKLPQIKRPVRIIRVVIIDGKHYQISSPNSKQSPYYAGPCRPAADELPPLSRRRFNGHLGPADATYNPLYFDWREPHLAFIKRGPDPDPFGLDDLGSGLGAEIEWTEVHTVWERPGADSNLGRLSKEFVLAFGVRIGGLQPESFIRNAYIPTYSKDEVQALSTIDGLRHVIHPKTPTACRKKRAAQNADIPLADDTFVGLWLNGDQLSELDFLWFLLCAKVPCFIIEEVSPEPALTSFIAGTIVDLRKNYDRYQTLALECRAELQESCPAPHSPADVDAAFAVLIQTEPDDSTFVIAAHPLRLLPRDFRRLNDKRFLNDAIIDFELKRLHDQLKSRDETLWNATYIFDTTFYTVLVNGVRRSFVGDFKSKRFFLVPIHNAQEKHWSLIIIYEPPPKPSAAARLSESLHPEVHEPLDKYMSQLRVAHNVSPPAEETRSADLTVPQQTDLQSCGVFLLHYARLFLMCPLYYLSLAKNDAPHDISQAHWDPEGVSRADLRARIQRVCTDYLHDWLCSTISPRRPEPEVIEVEDSDDEIEVTEPIALQPIEPSAVGFLATCGPTQAPDSVTLSPDPIDMNVVEDGKIDNLMHVDTDMTQMPLLLVHDVANNHGEDTIMGPISDELHVDSSVAGWRDGQVGYMEEGGREEGELEEASSANHHDLNRPGLDGGCADAALHFPPSHLAHSYNNRSALPTPRPSGGRKSKHKSGRQRGSRGAKARLKQQGMPASGHAGNT
ncbi:hypothetical protein DFH07DRAFT_768882 [Mycena maculata]|uniref:Ubiquitin-like protease family profile domain-containing protein n=1 Tax=Mycena maculata TaxID=230809 RepID=A0AAD7NPE4_9AGAR|nr:hypothetical protein DFH07DRAFT_768882 [Mycena maculata]